MDLVRLKWTTGLSDPMEFGLTLFSFLFPFTSSSAASSPPLLFTSSSLLTQQAVTQAQPPLLKPRNPVGAPTSSHAATPHSNPPSLAAQPPRRHQPATGVPVWINSKYLYWLVYWAGFLLGFTGFGLDVAGSL
ncbi:hypothetical protein AKJ16_DCAP18236 [Drosera capensis]